MIEHALARNPSNAHALAVGAVAYVWVDSWTARWTSPSVRCG